MFYFKLHVQVSSRHKSFYVHSPYGKGFLLHVTHVWACAVLVPVRIALSRVSAIIYIYVSLCAVQSDKRQAF